MPESFIKRLAQFYEDFFQSVSDSIRLLADIQEKYPEEYDSIKRFSADPQAIDEMINKLSNEDQALLLRILLKAGTFGKRLALLFEISSDDKKKLANEMGEFVKTVSKQQEGG